MHRRDQSDTWIAMGNRANHLSVMTRRTRSAIPQASLVCRDACEQESCGFQLLKIIGGEPPAFLPRDDIFSETRCNAFQIPDYLF